MQKFQELLSEAAQLKQSQLKQQRKNFQALPQYLKSGLNYSKKYIHLRKQHYAVQKYMSERLKKQGNDQYLLENYGQALSRYQQALSVFRFIYATKYQNLKDQDIVYENYNCPNEYLQQHKAHLVALYLNICSALTKMNKKQQAIHSSQEALKLQQNNAKIHYKKAQAYLQYINKDNSDIKLGFYYLNKAYQLSKDNQILIQMHKIKKQLDQERQKQKKWFKFMFDKNKQAKKELKQNQIKSQNNSKDNSKESNTNNNVNNQKNNTQVKKIINPQQKIQSKVIQQSSLKRQKIQKKQIKQSKNNEQKNNKKCSQQINDFMQEVRNIQKLQQKQAKQKQVKQKQNKNVNNNMQQKKNIMSRIQQQLQKFRRENEQNDIQQNNKNIQDENIQKCKQILKKYLIIPRDDRWLIKYQQDFIHKHGSKFYSILQLYNYKQYLLQFKSLLVKCLQLKQATITPTRDQNKILSEKIQQYQKFIKWVKVHPIEKYKKYIQRYDIQTKWIKNNRGIPIQQVFKNNQNISKQSINIEQKNKNQINNKQQKNNKQNKPIKKSQIKVQNIQKQQYFTKKTSQKTSSQNKDKNKDKNKNKHKNIKHNFKQQWQYQCQQQQNQNNEVPQQLKGFLQNYQEFPNYKNKSKQKDIQKQLKRQNNKYIKQQQQVQNPFSFIKSFSICIVVWILLRLIF